MAQNIILKRSSLSGKVPTTSSLNLGEIALNTYDGRAFIHKSGSTQSVEHIVVTNSTTTGSIILTQTGSFGELVVTNDLNVGDSVYVTNDIVVGGDVDAVGAVTASFFVGDGSLLTGISAGATDTEIPTNDWDYNLPDSGTLSDGNNVSTKYTVDFQAENYGARPVGYQTFITNTNGSTEIIPGTDGVVFIVNNQEVGRVDAGGIIGTTPMGTISSSAQITALGFVSSSTANIDTASFATTGSNIFKNRQYITGGIEVYSSTSPDIRIINGTTGIGYHIQNGDLGNFQIHNSTTDKILFQFNSASLEYGNQNASFFGSLSVSKSLSSDSVNTTYLTASYISSSNITGSIAATNGVISGSSQLTSSYDTRYTLSGSVQPLPSGVVSGSSQVTDILTSLNTFTASNANTSLNAATASYLTSLNGAISSSSQLTASFDLRYLVTGSVTSSILQLNTFTASNANTSLNTFTASNANTSLNAFTASNANTSLNLFTSSLNTWSSSVATTGSNSFNGNQTITGSLTVSSFASFSASFIANSSSLTLNSGSNLYIQNNGLAEITGSLIQSGSLTSYGPNLLVGNSTITGSISISSGSITMVNRPAFRVVGNASTERAAGLTLSGSAVTVDYNEGNYFSTSTGLFTAPIAGLYQVYYNGRTGGTNSMQQVIVYKNAAAALMWEVPGNTGVAHFGVSGIVKLAVNDTLRATVVVGSIQFDANDSFGAAYIG